MLEGKQLVEKVLEEFGGVSHTERLESGSGMLEINGC